MPDRKKIGKIIISIALLVVPAVLFLLPGDYFDTGESLCLSKRLLDLECFGCGITRGIQHLLHLEFGKAWAFNKLSFLVLPIAIYFWFRYLFQSYKYIFSK